MWSSFRPVSSLYRVAAPYYLRQQQQALRNAFIDRLDSSKAMALPPRNSWDSHMHVVGDPKQYPLSKSAAYTPEEVHTIEDAIEFEAGHGTPRMVLVQPSIYGTDNSCLLDALKVLTPQNGRGVVEVNPAATSLETLKEWHELGVRSIRVNIKSVSKRELPADELEALLKPYADLMKPLDWVLDLHIPLATVEQLEKFAERLGVRICIDHFGGPSIADNEVTSAAQGRFNPHDVRGFTSLIRLLRAGSTYVKLSGMYRLTNKTVPAEQEVDLRPFALEILREAPDQAIYASDWPHTRFGDKVDAADCRAMVLGWCGGEHKGDSDPEELKRKVFLETPDRLWR